MYVSCSQIYCHWSRQQEGL